MAGGDHRTRGDARTYEVESRGKQIRSATEPEAAPGLMRSSHEWQTNQMSVFIAGREWGFPGTQLHHSSVEGSAPLCGNIKPSSLNSAAGHLEPKGLIRVNKVRTCAKISPCADCVDILKGFEVIANIREGVNSAPQQGVG